MKIDKKREIQHADDVRDLAMSVNESIHDVAIYFLEDLAKGEQELVQWFNRRFSVVNSFSNYLKENGLLEQVLHDYEDIDYALLTLRSESVSDEEKRECDELYQKKLELLQPVYQGWLNTQPANSKSLLDELRELEARYFEIDE